MPINCPRCGKAVTSTPDLEGIVVCGSCNVRLRTLPAAPPTPSSSQLETLVTELRSVRRMQGEILQFQAQILALLKSQHVAGPPALPAPTPPSGQDDAPDVGSTIAEPPGAEAPPIPRVRQRRKTVLLVDDDPETTKVAVAALEEAQIPLRTVTAGHAALEAIAQDKPDVLVLELGLGEPMPGKDLINHIKATMEWVDVPIVLYTRIFVQSQQEARLLHGADEVVLKGPGSPEALVNRVIYLFQRH